ncbi:MAG: PilZ domain-containing protein [Hylemonella sp.]|nr:PilZ domain-containing protein [Hylemonella sp.]
MSQERRQFQRSVFHGPAHLCLEDRELVVGLLDVSMKGALVVLDEGVSIEVGQRCILRIELGSAAVIQMDAVATHVDGHRVGLRCDYIDIDSATHLRQLVERNAQDPSLLERDLARLATPPPDSA